MAYPYPARFNPQRPHRDNDHAADDWHEVDHFWQDDYFGSLERDPAEFAGADWQDPVYFGTGGVDPSQQYELGYRRGMTRHGERAMESAAESAWDSPMMDSPREAGMYRRDWPNRAPTYVGSYRGIGPKGYLRSGERLREVICERLTEDPFIDATDIDVAVTDRSVLLSGTVDSRRTKYEVEELVDRCGAADIDNRLRVTTNR